LQQIRGEAKEFAFHEFLKITFCKVFDEKYSSKPKFYILPGEQKSSAGQKSLATRIETLFAEVCHQYGYIFGIDETLKLKPSVIAYIVNELQKYSLLDTDFDYKGQAYEKIVGANSRGERGEFFTPRNLCALAVRSVIEMIGPEKLITTKVLDPACGTGGFLRTYVHELFEIVLNREIKKWKDADKSRDKAKEALKSICDQNVFGIDFNPVLVRAAQMNLVMHGDGSSNIFHENSLLSWGEWSDRTRAQIKEGSFDVVITNPPFGEDLLVDDTHILGQFALSSFHTRNRRQSMAPQELFIERCHRLLKPSGILAIVTPDNILSNPSYKFMRTWIVLNYVIVARFWLPGEMFQPSTGTQTSLLILVKRGKPYSNLEAVSAAAVKSQEGSRLI
jgi:type I restriction enzyme M protein